MTNLVFFDTESTGKDPDDRLVQICYAVPGLPPVSVTCKPGAQIKYEAMAVHHITEKMVAGLRPFQHSKEFGELVELAKTHVFVAHNAPFDIQILKNEGITVTRYIDTLKLARHLYPDEPMHTLQYLRYRLGVDIEAEAHDARGDVIVLGQLFKLFSDQFFFDLPLDFDYDDLIPMMEKISQAPSLLRRIGFGKHKGLLFTEIPKDYLRWMLGQKDVDPDVRFTCEQALKPKAVQQELIHSKPTTTV